VKNVTKWRFCILIDIITLILYNKYLMKPAIITDLDGTLALAKDRHYLQFDRVSTDTPDPMVRELLYRLTQDGERALIAVTGRPDLDNCREDTRRWVEEAAKLRLDLLLMRDEGDHSPDVLVKQRLFREHVLGFYSVELVLEDKPSLVTMWREEGLRCYEVANNERRTSTEASI